MRTNPKQLPEVRVSEPSDTSQNISQPFTVCCLDREANPHIHGLHLSGLGKTADKCPAICGKKTGLWAFVFCPKWNFAISESQSPWHFLLWVYVAEPPSWQFAFPDGKTTFYYFQLLSVVRHWFDLGWICRYRLSVYLHTSLSTASGHRHCHLYSTPSEHGGIILIRRNPNLRVHSENSSLK